MNGWASGARLTRARQHYEKCLLCEHRCAADRLRGQRGPCKADGVARVFKHQVEVSEESELVPAHLFYLSGCDLRCIFCIAEMNAFNPRLGRPLTIEFFREAVAWGKGQGARTLEWVGGEPTVHLPVILEVMANCTDLPPVIWKSDFHFTPEALDLLEGVVDVYLADFKFGNNGCASRLAGVKHYWQIVTRNLTAVASGAASAPRGDLIVRHLLMPGHFDCCFRPVVDWLRDHLPEVKFSIREGYLPRWQALHYDEMANPLRPDVADKARKYAQAAGLNLIV